MPVLAGAADLATICACVFYLALLVVASWVVSTLLSFTNISLGILGHPFKNIATDALNGINETIDAQIEGTETAISTLWSGFTWLIQQGGNAIAALAGATYGTFNYLWQSGIALYVGGLIVPITQLARQAYDAATSASAAVGPSSQTVDDRIATAKTDAETYTDSEIKLANQYTDTQTAAAVTSAGVTAGQLVSQAITLETSHYNELKGDFSTVPAEISAAIAKVPTGVTEADITAAINAALAPGQPIAQAISQATTGLGTGVSSADVQTAITDALAPGQPIAQAIQDAVAGSGAGVTEADVDAAIGAALAPGQPIAVAIEGAVAGAGAGVTEQDVQADIAAATLPGQPIAVAIANALSGIAIPAPPGGVTIPTPSLSDLTLAVGAVTAAVAGIEAISFIGGQDCQDKVGQVCGTDDGAWTNLLQGLTLLALAFDFQEFVDVATDLANAVGGIVGELEQPFLGSLKPLTLAA